MARLARVIAAGIPHHVTQRGNRRLPTFFREQDYRDYLRLMAQWCRTCGIEIWANCLMPNHVHLIAVPDSEKLLRSGIGEAHRRYSRMINFREGWRGHLWQGRFSSFPMDEIYLLAGVRYVEMNPLRAGLVPDAESWSWSSVRAHLAGEDDELVRVKPLLEIVGNWKEFLGRTSEEEDVKKIRKHEHTGRPLGGESFVRRLESLLGRCLRPQKTGPKVKQLSMVSPEYQYLTIPFGLI